MWRIPTDTAQTAVPNGHTKLQTVTQQTPLDDVFKAWDEDGAVVIKGLLTPEQVAEFNAETEAIMAQTPRGARLERLQAFHGRQTKRAGGLANHSRVFREHLLDNDFIHAVCKRNYSSGGNAGDYWLYTGTTLTAGGPQEAQPLHRDNSHYPPAVLLGPQFDDVQITFIVALSPFRAANGATRIIPGSHKWPFDQRGSADMTIAAEMDAGDCCLISGKVVHGMGGNSTTDERKAVQISVCAGYLTPSEAHSHIVSLDVAKTLSRRAQRFLGFRSQYTRGSPGLWMKDYVDLALHFGLDDFDGLLEDLREREAQPTQNKEDKLY